MSRSTIIITIFTTSSVRAHDDNDASVDSSEHAATPTRWRSRAADTVLSMCSAGAARPTFLIRHQRRVADIVAAAAFAKLFLACVLINVG
jgi:hypothetical protein